MSLRMRTSCGFALSMVVLLLASSGLSGLPPADSSPGPLPAGPAVRLEISDDPYLPSTAQPPPPEEGTRQPRDRSQGVQVEILNDPICIQLMRDFIKARPELWNEDIGV